jgi:hypothetical protein
MKQLSLARFEELIDPAKCRVDSFPGLVAVFGGTISDDSSKLLESKRNVFIQWIKKTSNPLGGLLVIPENYTDWKGLGKYKDLMAFEKDLGYLTDAVVVFLEGPGSFAELGAFSQIPSLASKLLVVIASEHHRDDSFISLGPVRGLVEQYGDGSICILPSAETADLEPDINLLTERLSAKQQRTKKTEAFHADKEDHQVFAALDLIDLFLALRCEELEEALIHLGVQVDRNRVQQLLFLLEKVGLINRINYGDQRFYLPKVAGKHALLNYSSSSKTLPFNRLRWRTMAIQDIAKQGPRRRVCETLFGKERFQSWIS